MLKTCTLAAALFACAATLVAVPAGAQNTDVIEKRQDDMKTMGKSAKAAGGMLKGEVAFDPAKAAEIFTAMNTAAQDFGTRFPDDSKTGGKTEASPAIWQKPEAFKAKLTKFQGDIAAAVAAKPATLDAFKTAFGAVGQNCKGCHEEFRVEKK